nr:uncharacterized protein LOC129259403 [Lytechinus pictus]
MDSHVIQHKKSRHPDSPANSRKSYHGSELSEDDRSYRSDGSVGRGVPRHPPIPTIAIQDIGDSSFSESEYYSGSERLHRQALEANMYRDGEDIQTLEFSSQHPDLSTDEEVTSREEEEWGIGKSYVAFAVVERSDPEESQDEIAWKVAQVHSEPCFSLGAVAVENQVIGPHEEKVEIDPAVHVIGDEASISQSCADEDDIVDGIKFDSRDLHIGRSQDENLALRETEEGLLMATASGVVQQVLIGAKRQLQVEMLGSERSSFLQAAQATVSTKEMEQSQSSVPVVHSPPEEEMAPLQPEMSYTTDPSVSVTFDSSLEEGASASADTSTEQPMATIKIMSDLTENGLIRELKLGPELCKVLIGCTPISIDIEPGEDGLVRVQPSDNVEDCAPALESEILDLGDEKETWNEDEVEIEQTAEGISTEEGVPRESLYSHISEEPLIPPKPLPQQDEDQGTDVDLAHIYEEPEHFFGGSNSMEYFAFECTHLGKSKAQEISVEEEVVSSSDTTPMLAPKSDETMLPEDSSSLEERQKSEDAMTGVTKSENPDKSEEMSPPDLEFCESIEPPGIAAEECREPPLVPAVECPQKSGKDPETSEGFDEEQRSMIMENEMSPYFSSPSLNGDNRLDESTGEDEIIHMEGSDTDPNALIGASSSSLVVEDLKETSEGVSVERGMHQEPVERPERLKLRRVSGTTKWVAHFAKKVFKRRRIRKDSVKLLLYKHQDHEEKSSDPLYVVEGNTGMASESGLATYETNQDEKTHEDVGLLSEETSQGTPECAIAPLLDLKVGEIVLPPNALVKIEKVAEATIISIRKSESGAHEEEEEMTEDTQNQTDEKAIYPSDEPKVLMTDDQSHSLPKLTQITEAPISNQDILLEPLLPLKVDEIVLPPDCLNEVEIVARATLDSIEESDGRFFEKESSLSDQTQSASIVHPAEESQDVRQGNTRQDEVESMRASTSHGSHPGQGLPAVKETELECSSERGAVADEPSLVRTPSMVLEEEGLVSDREAQGSHTPQHVSLGRFSLTGLRRSRKVSKSDF